MQRFSNILCVADRSGNESPAFRRALAQANNNQAQLTVVGLVEATETEKTTADPQMRRLLEAMINQRQDELQGLIETVTTNGIEASSKVLVGKGYQEIIREVLRHERDLVIKTAEPIEGIKQLFGSTDMKLLRKCPCALWLIKSIPQERYRAILAAVDFDPDASQADTLNQQILEMATSLALSESAQLHVVHAWRLPHERFLRSKRSGFTDEEIDALAREEETRRIHFLETLVETHCSTLAQMAADCPNPQLHCVKGPATWAVPALVENLGAELVVMGTVGRSGIPGMLIGNTAETILRQIDCSVLTVKPAGFVTPVTLED